MIPFSKASITDLEEQYVLDALRRGKLCGDGHYSSVVQALFETQFNVPNLMLTTSCSHALDMSAMLLDLCPGDEVIVPSYTFTSTANAIMLRGATPVFCEIDPRTFNIDHTRISDLITPRTKAIFVVHYAGVCCEMRQINEIARNNGLSVVEDAAQAVGSTYQGVPAGTLSDIGCYSFHETKNYVMGEGGAIILNNPSYRHTAEMVREKGTNRSSFLRGEVDKYTWQCVGSSYLPSDALAAMLFGQLQRFDEIMNKRMRVWNHYHKALSDTERDGLLIRPHIPEDCAHNAHMYYIVLPTAQDRDQLLTHLKNNGIYAVFHYVPLHSSPVGLDIGYNRDSLPITSEYAERIIRLPLYADMTYDETECVIEAVKRGVAPHG